MVNFTTHHIDVYRLTTKTVRGSLVEEREELYTGIPISLWKSSRFYGDTQLATQTNMNKYTVDLGPQYKVHIGDIMVINGLDYKIDEVIPHPDRRGRVRNYELFISATTDGDI